MDATHRQLLAQLEGIDTSGWVHLGGTAAGGYFEASPGVVVAVPRARYRQNADDARRSLEEFQRIANDKGRSLSIIILVDRVSSQDAASRRVWSGSEGNRLRSSLALVCASLLSRAIGSFFIGLNRPAVPTKMFSSFEQALAWSETKARETGAEQEVAGAESVRY